VKSARARDWRRLDGVEIAVPASVGNVGPGFDAVSLALKLYLRARIVGLEDDGRGRLTFTFGGFDPAGENRVSRAFETVRARDPRPLPSATIHIDSDIPPRAGLGSSAAAAVAGLRLFEAFTAPLPIDTLIAAAASIEGHPDNAASALGGGLTACCERDDGSFLVWSWPWPDSIKCLVATPDVQLETAVARRVLPADVRRADAVFNLQHTLLLVHAIESGDRALLREALRDRLHQPFRRDLVPGLDHLLHIDHPAVLGVCLSGSGPSVVAFADGDFDDVEASLLAIYRELGLGCTVRCLSVHQKGAQ
jgi:homoserine kinase